MVGLLVQRYFRHLINRKCPDSRKRLYKIIVSIKWLARLENNNVKKNIKQKKNIIGGDHSHYCHPTMCQLLTHPLLSQ